jgi:hypothetical protein
VKKRLTLIQIRNHPFLLKRQMNDRINSSRSSCTVCIGNFIYFLLFPFSQSLRSDSGYFDTSISSRQQANESRGPTTLNSLPPLMMNKNQKM